MKKNIFLILSVSCICYLFAISALCNLCTASPIDNAGKIDIDPWEANNEPSDLLEPAESNDVLLGDEISNQPTVSLKIYQGPVYSPEDDVCYYRIEAIVTGDPMPNKVEFSKDDSNGSWGPFRAQVNLTRQSPVYILTANVSTPEGSDSDSIEVRWGCDDNVVFEDREQVQ